MSDLDRPNCELAIRISSPGRRRADIRQEALQPGRGPQLDRIRDFLLWEGDTRGADVQRNLVAFLLGPKNLVPRDRNHLPPLLVLEKVTDGTGHRTQLYEKEDGI